MHFCSTCGLALADAPAPTAQPAPPAGYPGTAAGAATFGPGTPYQSYAPPPAPPSRSRPGWVIPVVLLVVVAAGIGAFLLYRAANPTERTVLVTLSLYNGSNSCDVGLGYSDIPGGTVVISGDGVPLGSGTFDYFGTDEGFWCDFTARIENVPTDKSMYSLSLDNGNRGVLTEYRSELEANGWRWGLSLGND